MSDETQTGNPVGYAMQEKFENLFALNDERSELIQTLTALPPSQKGKVRYEPVTGEGRAVFGIFAMLKPEAVKKLVADGHLRKLDQTVAKNPAVGQLDDVDRKIKAEIDALKQVMLAQKVAGHKRASPGTGSGSHVITEAWFTNHQTECPAPMDARWEEGRITYNLPKKAGQRGGTTSHGALNNILKAFGGRVAGTAPVTIPVTDPVTEPKKVPVKKGKKN